MIIIVTGTIAPGQDVKQLVIRNSIDRLGQYLSELEKLINKKPDAGIVFCENSGFGTDAFAETVELAKRNGIDMEVLSFQGNSEAVASKGKGFGEGEIVKYVLENSKLVHNENYMIKITGRLAVENISDIVSKIKKDCVYFNIPNIHRRDFYHTRLYAMPISVFKKFFIDEYRNVNDDAGYYLEYAYTDVIKRNKLAVRNFPRYPRIVGKSGSGGIVYEYTEWKSIIKDVLSLFNVYAQLK